MTWSWSRHDNVLIIAVRWTPFLLYTLGTMERAHGGALNSEMGYPTMLPPSGRKNTHTDLLTSYHICDSLSWNKQFCDKLHSVQQFFRMVDFFFLFFELFWDGHIWLSAQQPFNITPGGLMSWINLHLALRESRACNISVLWYLTPPWLSATGYFVTLNWKYT